MLRIAKRGEGQAARAKERPRRRVATKRPNRASRSTIAKAGEEVLVHFKKRPRVETWTAGRHKVWTDTSGDYRIAIGLEFRLRERRCPYVATYRLKHLVGRASNLKVAIALCIWHAAHERKEAAS